MFPLPCLLLPTAGEIIIAAARKALQHAVDSSRSSKRSQSPTSWLPVLPAACSAFLSVLVHTEGVEAAGQVLLREHEGQAGQPVQAKSGAQAAAGRKGKAGASSSRQVVETATSSAVLTLPAVNSFMCAAVDVAEAYQRQGLEDEAESAAQAAVQVATELFKQQLLVVSMGAAGALAALQAAPSGLMAPDAVSWACCAQLYGVLGLWQQVANIVLVAVQQQLPEVAPEGLQVVLAGAAAALNAAGRHVAAVQLLDGLAAEDCKAVSHPRLAQQLVAAAEADYKAWQVGALGAYCCCNIRRRAIKL